MLFLVMPVVLRALNYDILKGNCSVGAHVRDAGCYVCWAFARAYEPSVLKDLITDLANSLLVICCFDREVTMRPRRIYL